MAIGESAMLSTKQRRSAKRTKAAPRASPPANELNAWSRAQLGPEENGRAYRPLPDDASVEDPLQDWPDD